MAEVTPDPEGPLADKADTRTLMVGGPVSEPVVGGPVAEPDKADTKTMVGGPVSEPWREGTLTRATELQALCAWVLANYQPRQDPQALHEAILGHLDAARDAAKKVRSPKERFRPFRSSSRIERAMSNLDAAEAELLNFAPASYIAGQMPSLLNHVQRHLSTTDPRRQEFERIARKLGVKDPDHPLIDMAREPVPAESAELLILVERVARRLRVDNRSPAPSRPKGLTRAQEIENTIERERGKIVTTVRGASSAALREQLRVRSFRNILVVTILGLTILAVGIAILGWLYPTRVPLCYQPSLESGESVVVCPTAYSNRLRANTQPGPELNIAITEAARPWDHLTVELVGLTAAALAAATSIRSIRGSSASLNLPVLLALLKLPTGAITAFLGLLLIRGEFIPGLSALDTPGQILAWALVFGFSQQVFTRFVDQQGQNVLNSVRSPEMPNKNSPTNQSPSN